MRNVTYNRQRITVNETGISHLFQNEGLEVELFEKDNTYYINDTTNLDEVSCIGTFEDLDLAKAEFEKQIETLKEYWD